MHWFNAACWFFLLGSGFALLAGEKSQPIGEWWSALWSGLFGPAGLLTAHIAVGVLWAGIYGVYSLAFLHRDVAPFLREIFALSPRSDFLWCLRKAFWLILGPVVMRKIGLEPTLPPQGFYNAGQKLVAIAAVICGVGLVLTGILLAVSVRTTGLEQAVQWALLAHLCCAGLMSVLLPVHIYMAAFAPGERPALLSMFTGVVPADFARHHNPLWYASLAGKESERQPPGR
jgi:formate dehydrogenase subunit gamma